MLIRKTKLLDSGSWKEEYEKHEKKRRERMKFYEFFTLCLSNMVVVG